MYAVTVLVKYFFIALCGFYVICKLQNLKASGLKICFLILGAIFSSLLYMVAKKAFPQLYILAIVIPFLLLAKIILNQPFKTIIPIGLISIALSFFLAIISAVIVSFFMYLFQQLFNFEHTTIANFIQNFAVGVLQTLLVFFIFKIRRFSKGITNLDKYVDSDLSMYISVAIIFFMSFGEIRNNENVVVVFVVLLILFLGINMIFVWKMHLRKTYIERQVKKDIDELNEKIELLKRKNSEISAENEALSSVIHRDNKTISSLINKLSAVSRQTTDELTRNELIDFYDYLQKENADRNLYFHKEKNHIADIPKTDVFAVDSMIELMSNKAADYKIDFKLTLDCSVRDLITKCIDEVDLTTILADLLENAIIATKHSQTKLITLQVGFDSGEFSLKVSDTGIPFEPIILENFGKKNLTTHKNEGGSGIGLVTIYNILNKNRCSLYLNQNEENKLKAIEIKFDKKSELKIYAYGKFYS